MANPSKARGTAAETKVVKWLNENGWPLAERRALQGRYDTGDISGIGDVVIEVKDVRTEGTWSAHMTETEVERRNAGATYGVLLKRRVGRPDVGEWYAVMPVKQLFQLLRQVKDVT
jgi:hypothetical protein